jgi:hypothetical protein
MWSFPIVDYWCRMMASTSLGALTKNPMRAGWGYQYAARIVVNRLKSELQQAIAVDLLLKPNDTRTRLYRAGIDQIDYHVPETYERSELERILRSRQQPE